MIILRGMKSTYLITKGCGKIIAGYYEIHHFVASIAKRVAIRMGK